MGYVAIDRLRWGDGWIEPGEGVPDEDGRDYAGMLRLGQVAQTADAALMSDDQVRAELSKVTAERDALKAAASDDAVPDLAALDELPDELDGVPLVDGRPEKAMAREIEVEEGTAGEFRKRPSATVKAARLISDVKVLTPHGVMDGHAGDWLLVNTGNGEAWPVDPPYFEANYEPAEAGDETADEDGDSNSDPLPEGVVETSPGWFELPDGRKVRRKDIDAALAETTE